MTSRSQKLTERFRITCRDSRDPTTRHVPASCGFAFLAKSTRRLRAPRYPTHFVSRAAFEWTVILLSRSIGDTSLPPPRSRRAVASVARGLAPIA
jgi:hypothetical protein